MSLLIFPGLTPVFAVRFAHSMPAKLAARKRWTALSKLLRETACFQSHAASAAAGSREGLPSLVGFGAKPQCNLFLVKFLFVQYCALRIGTQKQPRKPGAVQTICKVL